MASKGFRVKVRLDLHAITCPGVWLCPSGETALRITSLGSTLESHRVSPIFPLLFHDEFNFKKTFTRLAALTELQRKLEQETIRAELIQWLGPCNRVVALATFETNLADVLYPVSRCKRSPPGVDVDLLMDPTRSFPGIIAPKIEISTRTVIEEVLAVFDGRSTEGFEIDSATTIRQRAQSAQRRRPAKGIIRQKRVCHGRTHPGFEIPRPGRYRCADNLPICYQPLVDQRRRRDLFESLRDVHDQPRERRVVSVAARENVPRLFDGCPICSTYERCFGCEHDRPSDGDAQTFARASRRDWNEHRCPDNDREAKRRISECDRLSAAPRDRCDASRGFYGNLEKFYKRMYERAKLRGREIDTDDDDDDDEDEDHHHRHRHHP